MDNINEPSLWNGPALVSTFTKTKPTNNILQNASSDQFFICETV